MELLMSFVKFRYLLPKNHVMKFTYRFSIIIFALNCLTNCKPNSASVKNPLKLDAYKNYDVIVLAGQSNMIGLGDPQDIQDFDFPINVVYYNISLDTNLNVVENNFGPEVGIAKLLGQKLPDKEFILIKYAVGGSSLNDWSPHQDELDKKDFTYSNLYTHMLNTVENLTSNYKTTVKAFIWMQGEKDASELSLSQMYLSNFNSLVLSLRKDFKNPTLPVLFGEINMPDAGYPGSENVKHAQLSANSATRNLFLIHTHDLEKQNDQIHFNSEGLLTLGYRFGLKLHELVN